VGRWQFFLPAGVSGALPTAGRCAVIGLLVVISLKALLWPAALLGFTVIRHFVRYLFPLVMTVGWPAVLLSM